MTKEEFIVQIKKTFPNVDSSFFSQIEVYKDFLRKTNQTLNLTRLDKEEKIYGEYFFESIFPFSFLDFSKPLSLLDIGSGSGIPGIVLKILFPQIKLTIIESSNKKVSFLKLLCDTLKIEATILWQRAEEVKKEQREKYDIVTSRAVASLKVILEISIAYAKVNGLLVEVKGANYQKEIEEANRNIDFLKLKMSKKLLPNGVVLIFKKTQKTDLKIPRTWKKITES